MEDVSRDAGDIATRLELNLVRTIGDALVTHVEGCILGQIDARSLCRGVGVLGRVFRTDLKVDTVLRGALLCIGSNVPGVLGSYLHVRDVDAVGR